MQSSVVAFHLLTASFAMPIDGANVSINFTFSPFSDRPVADCRTAVAGTLQKVFSAWNGVYIALPTTYKFSLLQQSIENCLSVFIYLCVWKLRIVRIGSSKRPPLKLLKSWSWMLRCTWHILIVRAAHSETKLSAKYSRWAKRNSSSALAI